MTVNFPCLIKLSGDDELIYLRSESCLIEELEALIWSQHDLLIDSEGQGFNVKKSTNATLSYKPANISFSTEQVTQLIQAHEFANAQTCLTKIQFRTIKDAINALGHNL